MTRRTSVLAYQQIKELGLLSKRRFEAYRELFTHGPATASELIRKVIRSGGESPPIIKSLHKRLSDLVRLGVAYEVQERKCKVTGRVVIEFDVTEKLPTKPEKRLSKLEAAHVRIKELEAEVTRLKDYISEMSIVNSEAKRQLLLLR